MSFENRPRFSLKDAWALEKKSCGPAHVLENGDGTYSVMSHINCEFCDYCEDEEDKRITIHIPKSDPYAHQKILFPENYE